MFARYVGQTFCPYLTTRNVCKWPIVRETADAIILQVCRHLDRSIHREQFTNSLQTWDATQLLTTCIASNRSRMHIRMHALRALVVAMSDKHLEPCLVTVVVQHE